MSSRHKNEPYIGNPKRKSESVTETLKPRGLAIARKHGWVFDIMSTSFFVSRRSIKVAAQSGMPIWQDQLFIALARNAYDATSYFQIPTGRVVEVGTQVSV